MRNRPDLRDALQCSAAVLAVAVGSVAGVFVADWLWINHIITRGTP